MEDRLSVQDYCRLGQLARAAALLRQQAEEVALMAEDSWLMEPAASVSVVGAQVARMCTTSALHRAEVLRVRAGMLEF